MDKIAKVERTYATMPSEISSIGRRDPILCDYIVNRCLNTLRVAL